MTLKHKLKLILAHFRWIVDVAQQRVEYAKRWCDFLNIRDLFIRLKQEYLIAQRVDPKNIDTYILQGKVELLQKILDEGWN